MMFLIYIPAPTGCLGMDVASRRMDGMSIFYRRFYMNNRNWNQTDYSFGKIKCL